MRDLTPLLAPRSIAIIGASDLPGRVGGVPLSLLVQHRYAGQIYPVNPKYESAQGLRCFPDIESLPEAVDVAVLAVGGRDVLPMLQRCSAKGVKAAVIFAAGFAEAGDEGRALQSALDDFASTTRMLIAGPNCMGFANLLSHAYTTFGAVFRSVAPSATPGDTALLTQSGNVCSTVYRLGRLRGVAFNHVINTGNEAFLEFSEYLEWLGQDPGTECVVGYVEGLRDGPRFIRAVERMQRAGKPLILLKVGDSAKGREAAASHTAALAGDQDVYRAALRQLNVMLARDLGHMADLAYLARFKHRSVGSRMAILTVSGALGALLSDRLHEVGIEIPTLPDTAQQLLRAVIPDYGMVANPVDFTGNLVNNKESVRQCLSAVAGCDQIDAIVLYAPGYLLEGMAPDLIEASRRYDKLVIVIDTLGANCREALEEAGMPVFDDSGRAVQALGTFVAWSQGVGRARRAQAAPAGGQAACFTVGELTQLDEVESKRLIASHGVAIPHERLVQTGAEAVSAANEIGYPCVLKIVSEDIPHKTDAGGVRLNLNSPEQVEAAFRQIDDSVQRHAPRARRKGLLLARQERAIAELLVGVTRDPIFGLVMTVGLGGVLTEIYKDVAHRMLPVSPDDAAEMLRELKSWPLLDGFRGRPLADVEAACQAIAAISSSALAIEDRLSELEVNPLMLRSLGDGAVAVDCLVTVTRAVEVERAEVDSVDA